MHKLSDSPDNQETFKGMFAGLVAGAIASIATAPWIMKKVETPDFLPPPPISEVNPHLVIDSLAERLLPDLPKREEWKIADLRKICAERGLPLSIIDDSLQDNLREK